MAQIDWHRSILSPKRSVSDMNPEEPQMDRGNKRLISRLWPLLLFVVAIFLSSSTVITPKQFVQAVSRYSPIKLS